MRIISSFQDYYDSARGYGEDESGVTYVRETVWISAPPRLPEPVRNTFAQVSGMRTSGEMEGRHGDKVSVTPAILIIQGKPTVVWRTHAERRWMSLERLIDAGETGLTSLAQLFGEVNPARRGSIAAPTVSAAMKNGEAHWHDAYKSQMFGRELPQLVSVGGAVDEFLAGNLSVKELERSTLKMGAIRWQRERHSDWAKSMGKGRDAIERLGETDFSFLHAETGQPILLISHRSNDSRHYSKNPEPAPVPEWAIVAAVYGKGIPATGHEGEISPENIRKAWESRRRLKIPGADSKSWYTLIANPCLRQLQMERIMDPFTCWQAVENTVDGVCARPGNPMAGLTDDDIRDKHGFDPKYGFRTRPGGNH